MSEKHDRSYARTAQDIERKYKFGKTFAEMLGLINDNRDKVDSVESSLADRIEKTETTLRRDAEKIVMSAKKEIVENGVTKVITETGYKFDADGLNISKSGSEMDNTLDNTGMYVKRSGQEVLTANNKGVGALNLHAKTYLIIGKGDGKSRFEDYGTNRTGCFWIGG